MDKNQAMVEYLSECPEIAENPTFFNFASAKDNNKQIVTIANEKNVQKPYIDGSVLKQYNFTIVAYVSVSYQALVKVPGYTSENVEDMFDIQSIITWITQQNKEKKFPDFGIDCDVTGIETTTENPNLNGVDTSLSPPLAKYSVTIRVTYIDNSNKIWG